jgi:bifunctional DNA-binding transcriptional regulator/antitoxin component of YhaV-PrlF toxin-antitoxin module
MARGRCTTALVATGGGSNSLRTTVPHWIVEQFGMKSGSKLEWCIRAEGSKMTIFVEPVE